MFLFFKLHSRTSNCIPLLSRISCSIPFEVGEPITFTFLGIIHLALSSPEIVNKNPLDEMKSFAFCRETVVLKNPGKVIISPIFMLSKHRTL